MIKQVLKFISICIITNLLFIPTAYGKKHNKPVDMAKNTCKAENKKTQENKKKPKTKDLPVYKDNPGQYTALYGVSRLDDIYNSYFEPDLNKENKEDK